MKAWCMDLSNPVLLHLTNTDREMLFGFSYKRLFTPLLTFSYYLLSN